MPRVESIARLLLTTESVVEETNWRWVTLLPTQVALDKVKGTENERIGVEIVRKAIEEPLRMIAQNAGAEGGGMGGCTKPLNYRELRVSDYKFV